MTSKSFSRNKDYIGTTGPAGGPMVVGGEEDISAENIIKYRFSSDNINNIVFVYQFLKITSKNWSKKIQ